MTSIVAPVKEHRVAAYEARSTRADLERLTYSISHDLRAPVRQIESFLALFIESLGDDLSEEQLLYATYARDTVERLNQMIVGMVRYNRLGDQLGEARELDLERVIRRVLREEYAAEASRVSIANLPTVLGHPRLLRRLFGHLIGNAIKFSRGRPDSPIVLESVPTRAGMAKISITDHGAGFDGTRAGKLFHVFQRLHGIHEFEGLGLGLAEARRIAEIHGGRIEATGTEGEGAVFSVSFPLPVGGADASVA